MSDELMDTPSKGRAAPAFEFAPEELEAFRGTGHEFLKLHAPNAIDANGRSIGKAPGFGWRKANPLDIDEARETLEAGTNVGVRLRETDLVVDVDPRSFDEGDDPVQRLCDDLGIELDDWPRVDTGSGGSHFYMTVPKGTLVRDTVEQYPGIEFKGHGRQMVAPGSSHPETKRAYRWDPLSEPVRAAKASPAALLDLIRRPAVQPSGDGGEFAPEKVELMLSGLDPSDFRDHDAWFEIMLACHHASSGDAREEFIAWSIGDPQYSGHAELIGRRWDSLHADGAGRRVTVRTLFKALNRVGNGYLIDEAQRVPAEEDFDDDLADLPEILSDKRGLSHIERLNTSLFTVLTSGKYLVGREQEDERLDRFLVEWFPDEAIRKHLNIGSIEVEDGKTRKVGDWWLAHSNRRQYDRVVFDPSKPGHFGSTYNLWRGWAVEPKAGDWSKLQELLLKVLCRGDQASYDYVLKWCAFMVQHPDTPAEVALVFKGPKGAGKGTFCRALKGLAGQHGKQVAQPEHFTGRFNEHLADTILLFVDEGLWAGDRRVEGVLKNLITEPTLSIEGKNKPIIEGPNHLHIVIASNEDWVIPATPDERRFAVFDVDEQAFDDLPAGFFEALHGQMEADGRAAMLHELLHVDLGDWHPRKNIPQTEALVAQKVEGFRSDPIAFWWYRKLEDGALEPLGCDGRWPDPVFVGSVGKEELLDDLHHSARANKHRAEFTKTKVARFLGRVGVDVGSRDRKGSKGWSVPSLSQAREAFEQYVGGQIDWGD